ncbi:hypothetical protein F8M41_005119 [Gigaspora margarita]|uniref:Uncharacterized protein n=1 Tax=Gigaspora margarita TaxID=4874 RepID=A0A8H4AXF3_GIGMA|nr:hypothetical protein F8M41_005119 [Gigaspora margarita]
MMNQTLLLSSTVTMNNGHKIPLIGIGMGGLSIDTEASQGEPTQNAVLWALEVNICRMTKRTEPVETLKKPDKIIRFFIIKE